MALILSIETSTTVCSAALHQAGTLVASLEIHQEYSHASKLAPLIDQLCKLSGYPVSKIGAIAISAGPGSYTGLRIGTSLAKGLCYSNNLPIIAISSLQVLGLKIAETNAGNDLLCPMIDARRMEVYSQVFDRSLKERNSIEAVIVNENSYSEFLDGQAVIFFGNGSDKCREIIRHPNAKFLSGITPSAIQLGTLAYQKWKADKFEDIHQFVPFYLKEFFTKKTPETLNET